MYRIVYEKMYNYEKPFLRNLSPVLMLCVMHHRIAVEMAMG